MVTRDITLYKSSKVQQMAWSISRTALVEIRIFYLNSSHILEKFFKISHLREICSILNMNFKSIYKVYCLFLSHGNSEVCKHFQLDDGLAPLLINYMGLYPGSECDSSSHIRCDVSSDNFFSKWLLLWRKNRRCFRIFYAVIDMGNIKSIWRL